MNACVISTFRCNAKCHMCDIWKYPTRKDEEITPEIVAKLPSGLGRVNLTGGEPFLRDDIEELVGILYKKCELVEISTNGYFTDRIIKIAKKYPKVMFRISIEGLPKLNDDLRGLKDGFDHAMRTILELKKTRVKDFGFSIVICDKNAEDLVSIYELCSQLGIEFGNSTMHNSWYFHKCDNAVNNVELAVAKEKEFMKSLLESKRSNLKMRVKDWLRAYFNINILQHIQGQGNTLNSCCAGTDLFFLDPYGNILPCNGTDDKWIMGNLKENTFEEIWSSKKAEQVRSQVNSCCKECAFIGTARFDMKRRPWKPISWILSNKVRIGLDKEIKYSA